MRAEVISDVSSLRALRGDWERLLDESGRVNPLAAPAAVSAWFRLAQAHSAIHVIAVYTGENLVGLAPFSDVRAGPFRLLASAGAGFGFYGDVLLGKDQREVAELLADELSQMVGSGTTVFYLRRLEVGGVWLDTLQHRDDLSVSQMSADEGNSVVRFDRMEDPEEYLALVGRKHQVPRLTRRLARQHSPVEYQMVDPDPVGAVSDMRDMMVRRFGADLRIFSDAQHRRLTDVLVREMVDASHARVSSLLAGDRRAAVAFVPFANGHSHWYAVAYEPDLHEFRVGHIEMFHMLQTAYQTGASSVDLGDSTFEYKARWATDVIFNRTVAVAAPGTRGQVANYLRRALTRLHRRRNLDRIPDGGPHIV